MKIKAARIGSPPLIALWLTLILAFIGAYFPVFESLVGAWYRSEDYSHGFLIIPVSLFLIWRKRDVLSRTQIAGSAWGLGIIFFSLCSYLLSHFAEIMSLASFSMVLFICGSVLYLFGRQVFKEIFFALLLLCFMIPIPAQIYATLTVPFQLFVSAVSSFLASIANIPVYREGNVIYLPEHTLQVVQACSGLRSMISLLTLSAIFGYLTLKSNSLRTILFFSGIPAAIAVNIFRILIMIAAFYFFNFDLAKGNVHTIFGLFIFIVALMIVAAVRGVLSIWDRSATAE
jgi:exosortase